MNKEVLLSILNDAKDNYPHEYRKIAQSQKKSDLLLLEKKNIVDIDVDDVFFFNIKKGLSGISYAEIFTSDQLIVYDKKTYGLNTVSYQKIDYDDKMDTIVFERRSLPGISYSEITKFIVRRIIGHRKNEQYEREIAARKEAEARAKRAAEEKRLAEENRVKDRKSELRDAASRYIPVEVTNFDKIVEYLDANPDFESTSSPALEALSRYLTDDIFKDEIPNRFRWMGAIMLSKISMEESSKIILSLEELSVSDTVKLARRLLNIIMATVFSLYHSADGKFNLDQDICDMYAKVLLLLSRCDAQALTESTQRSAKELYGFSFHIALLLMLTMLRNRAVRLYSYDTLVKVCEHYYQKLQTYNTAADIDDEFKKTMLYCVAVLDEQVKEILLKAIEITERYEDGRKKLLKISRSIPRIGVEALIEGYESARTEYARGMELCHMIKRMITDYLGEETSEVKELINQYDEYIHNCETNIHTLEDMLTNLYIILEHTP